MLNNNDTETRLATLTDARDAALAALQDAAGRVKSHGNGPLADLYELQLDDAFAAYEKAEDDLREVRDGYRNTYPHPAGKIHPFDGYRPGR